MRATKLYTGTRRRGRREVTSQLAKAVLVEALRGCRQALELLRRWSEARIWF